MEEILFWDDGQGLINHSFLYIRASQTSGVHKNHEGLVEMLVPEPYPQRFRQDI